MPTLIHEVTRTIKTKWEDEKEVLRNNKLTIFALFFAYYFHGVITNILRHYTIIRPALWDFGFESTKNINYTPLYNLTIIFRLVLYTLTLYVVTTHYVRNRQALLTTITLRAMTILIGVMTLRSGALLSTQLPPPHPLCTNKYTSPVNQELTKAMSFDQWIDALSPFNIPLPFSITPRVICGGDHTFSLHVVGLVLCVLMCLKYNLLTTRTATTIQFNVGMIVICTVNVYMIICTRTNYSLDIWVGAFTTVLVFLFLDRKLMHQFLPEGFYRKL